MGRGAALRGGWRAALLGALAGSTLAALVLVGAGASAEPLNGTAPTIAGTAVVGEHLVARPGDWSGSGALSYSYSWQSCDETGEVCEDLPGAHTRRLQLTEELVGVRIRVNVIARDSDGPTTASSVATTAVGVRPPLVDIPPLIAGIPLVGNTLEATGAQFAGAEPFTFGYQWRRCDAAGHACVDVGRATRATYSLGEADLGATLRVVQSATNDSGSAEATSEPSGVIVAPGLVNDDVPTIGVHDSLLGEELVGDPGRWSGRGPIAYTYRWQRCDASGTNCTTLPGATGSSYPLSSFDVGAALRLVVTATGASGSASATSAPTSAYAATAPANVAGPTVTGAAVDEHAIEGDPGAWTGTQPLDYDFQWERCDTEGAECAAIRNATERSYTPEASDIGSTLRLSVTATNATGSASAASSATAVVLASTQLVDRSAPSISGEPYVGELLSAEHGSWEGVGAVSYTYQWERCDHLGEDCVTIEGATGSTRLLSAEDAGMVVRVIVTASDATRSQDALAAASGPVMTAEGPRSTSAPTIAGTAAEGETLTAEHGSWEGRGGISYAYQWQTCEDGGCVDLADATEATYELTSEDVFSTVRVAVTATDDDGASTAVSAATGSVVAGTLSNWQPPTISGRAETAATLTADPGVWSQAASYTYAWERCDAEGEACSAIEGATETTYELVEADSGATIRVHVTATNVGGRADATSTLTGVVDAAPPVSSRAPALSGSAAQGETLTADEGTWSGAESVALQWRRCDEDGEECRDLPGETSTTHALRQADVGTTLRVVATATNATGDTNAISDASDVVASAELASTAVPAIAGTAEDGETLIGEAGEWSGSGTIEYSYQWRTCDAHGQRCRDVEGATGSSYALEAGDVGTTVRLRVIASNPWGSRSAVSEATDAVQYALPGNVVAPSLSGEAVANHTLTVDDGEWSGSAGDTDREWQRCDAREERCRAIDGATGTTLELHDDDIGETIRVVVTVTNARGSARATTDASAVVSADPPANQTPPDFASIGAITARAEPGSWSGTAPIEYAYQWERCTEEAPESCSDITGATDQTYELTEADVGAWIRVAVTADNDGGRATERSRAEGPLEALPDPPSAPVNLSSPETFGHASPGRQQTSWVGAWESTEEVTYAYQWQRCTGAEPPICSDIERATEYAYESTVADVGSTLRLGVTATNAVGSTRAVSTPTATVADAAPRAVEDAWIYHFATTRETLEVAAGDWSGSGPLTFEYQWRRCDAEGEACADIEGATTEAYEPVEADLGSALRVVVTARNGLGSGESTTAATEVVGEGRSINTGRPSIDGEALVGQTLTADNGEWDPVPAGFFYLWLRCDAEGENCTTVSTGFGRTGASYRLQAADYGHRMRLLILAELNGFSTEATTDATAAVDTHVPLSLDAPTVTGTPAPGELLSADVGRWVGDGTIEYAYQWESCNSSLSSCFELPATTSTFRARAFDTGRRLRVTVTASNEAGSVELTSVATEPVSRAAAGYLPPMEIEGEAVVGNTVNASALDFVPGLQLAYSWQRCDAGGESCIDLRWAGTSYTVQTADEGSTLRVIVSDLYDFWAPGAPTSTSPPSAVVAAAEAPGSTEAPMISGEVDVGERLSGEVGSWSGSPEIDYEPQWLRCDAEGAGCVEIDGAGRYAYRLVAGDVGSTLRLRVTATNGAGSVSVDSAPTIVVPAAPTLTNVFAPSIDEWSFLFYGEQVDWDQGAWTGAPDVTDSWQRCDQLAEDPDASCTDIPGATGDYVPQAADVGYQLRIKETAEAGAERATAYSDRSVEYVNGGVYEAGTDGATYTGRPAAGETVTIDPHIGAIPDTLPLTFTYTFERYDEEANIVVLQEGEDASYTLADEDVGYEVWVEIEAKLYRDDRALVVDTRPAFVELPTTEPPPTNDEPPTIEGEVALGARLTSDPGRWHGGGGDLHYSYAWQRCNAEGEACRAIDGADAASYTPTEADLEATLRVAVTAHADATHTTATSVATGPVAEATVLTSTEVPTITGTPAELELLRADTGAWSGSDPTAFAYQWQRCPDDEDEASCTDIENADEATYRLNGEDVGNAIRVAVTATNGAGEAIALSDMTDRVEAAPTPSGPQPQVALTGPPVPGAIASSYVGDWEHVASSDLEYQWQRCDERGTNCVDIDGADQPYHTLVEADVDSRLRLSVSAVNSSGSASRSSEDLPLVDEGGESAADRMVYADGPTLSLADADGTESTQIADCAALDPDMFDDCSYSHPRISPNGLSITVAVEQDDHSHVVVMNDDGSDQRVVADGDEPTWAVLGTAVVFTHHDRAGTALYSVRPDGLGDEAGTRLLDDATGDQKSAVYSPDGTTLAYVGRQSDDDAWGLYVLTRDPNATPRPLTLDTSMEEVADPTFTRDGSKILFTARPPFDESAAEPEETVRLYEVDPDGGNLQTLAGSRDSHFSMPAVAPDESITTQHLTYFWTRAGFGGYFTLVEGAMTHMRRNGTGLGPFPIGGETAPVDPSYGPEPVAVAATDLVVCPTNAPGDPVTRIDGDNEPNVIVRGWFRGLCRTQMAYDLKLCIEMRGGSDNQFHQQKCDSKQASPKHSWDFIDKKIDLLCRPGTRWYRLIAEVSWPASVPQVIPIFGDDHFEKHESHNFKINCNEAGAWRFHATHNMDFVELPATRIRSGEALGKDLRRALTVMGAYRDELDSGLPVTTTGGWAAHHLIAATDTREASAEAQRVAWDCRLLPNTAVNGLWLRGPALKRGTEAYAQLRGTDPLRPYHPEVHTNDYYDILERTLTQYATSSNECTSQASLKRTMRDLIGLLRLDLYPYRGPHHMPGDGD